jgi:DNA-binding SARP family transcriptional activator/WD40 repeat protein
VQIGVLGPLEVRADDGRPLAVAGAKERLLLAVLAVAAPGVVSVDGIVDALWSGAPPATARKSLQAHVVRLRSALEPGRPQGSTGRYVVRRGAGYALTVDRSDLDALAFADLVARGRALLAAGGAAAAERALTSALGCWRGEPYGDWPRAPFADAERQRLTELRTAAVTSRVEARLALGNSGDAVGELERLVVEQPLREDWWRLLMLALYRAGRQADALAAGRRVRALLVAELGTEPGPGLREMEAAILAQDPRLLADQRPGPGRDGAAPPDRDTPDTCPYKGLAAYREEDAPLFHGRQRLVSTLVGRLVDAPLLVVSGPSGAGKSSVVRAGLLPALAAGALPGSAAWRSAVVSPGRDPAATLAALAGSSAAAGPAVLVCDQAEELWASGTDPADRSAFLDGVLELLAHGAVVRCVVVVRGDHVARLSESAAFLERLGPNIVLVPPLTDRELREVVCEPADGVGLEVEADLVDAVVGDVLGRTGALPLLSAALVGTWERRRGRTLTLAGYLQAGGVAGALARSAEVAHAAVGEEGQAAARGLLVRLAGGGTEGPLVRRAVPLAELDLDGSPERRAVVEAFVARRLLAVDGDVLEVTHEALLTAWPRLARWLDDDAVGRRVRQHLAPAARDWADRGRPADELYRGARLAAALDWVAGPSADPTPTEAEFLRTSRERAEAELTEARQRAEREGAARRRTRWLAVALAALLAVALVATVLAVGSQREAERASVVADANRLAALSTTVGSLDASMLLAAQAVRLADTPETQDALLTALTRHGRAERVVPFGGDVQGAHLTGGDGTLFLGVGSRVEAWRVGPTTQPEPLLDIPEEWDTWTFGTPSPTEDVLVAGGTADGLPELRLLDADGTHRVLVRGAPLGGVPVDGRFEADGRRMRLVVVAPDPAAPDDGTDWRVLEVDTVDGAVRDTGVGGSLPAPPDRVAADFADDAGVLVLWDAERATTAVLVDLAAGARVTPPAQPGPGTSQGFVALPSGAAQLWDDGGVTLLDAGGALVQRLEAHWDPVRDVVLSPDGTWAVTVGDGAAVVLWDVDPATGRWSQRETLAGHDGDVVQVEADPAGERVYTASLDDTVIVWDMSPEGGPGISSPGLTDRWIANRPTVVDAGRSLVAPTRPGQPSGERFTPPGPDTLGVAATFLDPVTGRVEGQVEVGDTIEQVQFGASVAASPDGSMVAVTWGLGTTILDARTREVVTEIVLPPNGDPGIGNGPFPATVVWCAAWTPDGSHLLLGAEGRVVEGTGGYVATVDTETWRVDGQIDTGGSAQVIVASPDGRLLAAANATIPRLVILDAETLEVVQELPLDDDLVSDLSFSPDGRFLAGGGLRGLLHVYETATWRPVREPVAVHDEPLLQVEWLPDGRTAVTAGGDGTVSLFDVERGLVRARPLPTSGEPGQGYAHLVPDPTDELVVLSGDRAGRRYPLDPDVWLADVCAVVGRDLTRAEWDRYLPEQPYGPTCSDLG